MTTLPTTPLDPLNHVMHYELLKVAHSLVKRGQNESYWTNMPVPVRPIGKLRFEVAQQVATFAVPLLGWHWAYLHYGLKGLLLGIPVAWLTGCLLDLRLDCAIKAQARREEKRDAGRYRAVKWLCEQMGMRPEEVTLGVIHKMDKDYTIVQRLIDEKMAKYQAEQAAAKAEARRRRRSRQESEDSEDSNPSGTAITVTGYSYDSRDDDEDLGWGNAAPSYQSPFNPATGLPMVGNTFLDVGGNAYGTDSHTF
jgi:hypothetical protein